MMTDEELLARILDSNPMGQELKNNYPGAISELHSGSFNIPFSTMMHSMGIASGSWTDATYYMTHNAYSRNQSFKCCERLDKCVKELCSAITKYELAAKEYFKNFGDMSFNTGFIRSVANTDNIDAVVFDMGFAYPFDWNRREE